MPDLRGIAVGLLVGALVLALLFAGQVLSFAAFWLARAISGTVILLLAFGLGYAAYELYSGWSAADDSRSAAPEWEAETDAIDESDDEDIGATLSDEELQEELDVLREETESVEEDVMSETN
jgi:type VI protein secretion system component VasK